MIWLGSLWGFRCFCLTSKMKMQSMETQEIQNKPLPAGSMGALDFLFDMRFGALSIKSDSSSSSSSLLANGIVFWVGPLIYKSNRSRPILRTKSPKTNTCYT